MAQAAFDDAVARIARSGASLGNAEKLVFYGLYKQATQGRCDTARPSMLDMVGRAKWDAWSALGDMPRAEAVRRYIEEADRLVPRGEEGLQAKAGRAVDRSGYVVVSQPAPPEDELSDDAKTLWDWCKEGNGARVAAALRPETLNALDEEDMAPLHWASDRGHAEIVALLIKAGADVAVRDAAGQTPLHYACACEHESVVRALLAAGADPDARDDDGCSPADTTTCERIRALLVGEDVAPLAVAAVQEAASEESDDDLSVHESAPPAPRRSWSRWLRGAVCAVPWRGVAAVAVACALLWMAQRRRRAVPIRLVRR